MSEVTSKPTPHPFRVAKNRGLTSESHSVQITTIHLNRDHFLRWPQSVLMYIRGKGKIGCLTGDTKAADVKDPSFATWDAKNSMVMV